LPYKGIRLHVELGTHKDIRLHVELGTHKDNLKLETENRWAK
jgi:hypothetical protein